MRETTSMKITALLVPLFLALSAGCAGNLQSYRYDEHTIRIDQREGPQRARIYVDQCQVPGVYYDSAGQRWGVHGYTYGPAYYELEVLAEDLASWGASEWCDPRRAPPGLGQRADSSASAPDA